MKDVIGSEEARQAFRWLATRFSNGTDFRFELVAAGASGDLAYTVGYEHAAFSMDGGPVAPLTLRVTHVYRRETASGRSSTATPTPPRPVSSLPPTHRRSSRHSSGPGPRWGHIGATSLPSARDNTGQERSVYTPAQCLTSASIAGRHTTPVLSRTEEATGPAASYEGPAIEDGSSVIPGWSLDRSGVQQKRLRQARRMGWRSRNR